jgi:hypothetical protein
LRHMSLRSRKANLAQAKSIRNGIKFDRSSDAQRPSETGPPPTCPFI